MENEENIDHLISLLDSKDGMRRQLSRHALVKIGEAAVPFLMQSMSDPKKRIRWEAAKALVAIHDPRSAPVLVQALTDKSFEIRWLAAEGLVALQHDSLKPLLKALIESPDNIDLWHGVHHVLHILARERILNERCIRLFHELESIEAELTVPLAAKEALHSLSIPIRKME